MCDCATPNCEGAYESCEAPAMKGARMCAGNDEPGPEGRDEGACVLASASAVSFCGPKRLPSGASSSASTRIFSAAREYCSKREPPFGLSGAECGEGVADDPVGGPGESCCLPERGVLTGSGVGGTRLSPNCLRLG